MHNFKANFEKILDVCKQIGKEYMPEKNVKNFN